MTAPIEEQLITLFRLTKQHAQAIAEAHALTFPQLVALRHLLRSGPISMSDLTNRLGVTRGALTGLIDRLEAAEFVTRQPSSADRRVIFLALTEKGREVLGRVREAWRLEVDHWLAPLGESGQACISEALTMLIDAEARHARD